jgi:hypothetical protein
MLPSGRAGPSVDVSAEPSRSVDASEVEPPPLESSQWIEKRQKMLNDRMENQWRMATPRQLIRLKLRSSPNEPLKKFSYKIGETRCSPRSDVSPSEP